MSAAERSGAAPVRLTLPYHRINERSVRELGRIFSAHPGDNPVRLAVRGPSKTAVYQLSSMVDATTVASDIKGSFGQEAWQGLA
ncbi:hypothetical protein GCM10020367_63190 [Streptomyces sannanensis]|uniref:Uncharacterized protein n=1 Tax=Streptomyces sannanensis TaxID=285536 RepID=A0ABP6SM28_9ACTN